jgi:hypothetical protein
VPDGHLRWDDCIDALNDELFAAPDNWDATIDSAGRISLGGSSSIVTWDDRIGWLLGFGREAGDAETAATSLVSRFVPPGGIPCLGVTWDEVDVQRDREAVLDRSRRQQGYAFGGSRVWRVRATMTRWSLDALMTGWCLRGKISAVGADAAAISPSDPGGVLTGYVLGLEDVAWVDTDALQTTARVTLLVATTTA